MTSRAFHVAPAVAAVLEDVTVQDGAVKLPAELARPLYVAVNKALAAIGGRWDRRRAGHVFPAGVDPADRLAELLGTGKATSARAAGFFETPPQLVAELVAVAQILPRAPCARAVRRRTARSPSACSRSSAPTTSPSSNCSTSTAASYAACGQNPIQAGFLTADLDGPFDRIVMNPPFDQRQDVRHVAHAFSLLAPGGRLVAVMAEGVTYRDDRPPANIRALIDAHGSVTTNPARSFAASGTDIATVTVLLDKPAAPFAARPPACPAVGAGATHTHHHED